MKVIENTLNLAIERWNDPGDYPSGAGGGPLASYDFVAGVEGDITVELGIEDWNAIHEHADVDMTDTKMVAAWLEDNPGEIRTDQPGLTVSKWTLEDLRGDLLTLSVDGFEADCPGPPEREYDPMEEIERRERREKQLW